MADKVDASGADEGPTGRRVLVVGAAGNLGRRMLSSALSARHDVTACVRSRQALESRLRGPVPAGLKVIEGDALDEGFLRAAMRGQDAVVSCAGNAFDGPAFVRLFDAVAAAAEEAVGDRGRVWMMAGVAALDIPSARRRVLDLPGLPRAYRSHGENFQRLERSRLAWTLVCPGPMISATGPNSVPLRASVDALPVDAPDWLRWAPGLAVALFLKSKVPEMTVAYEDVARFVIERLWDTALIRRRVGLALPAGQTARKAGWRPGRRAAVE